MRDPDVLIIGGGSAGLAAAISLKEEGVDDVLVIEREAAAGGVLVQCIHNGFGLQRYNEELTGPEYAERELGRASTCNVDILTSTAAVRINSGRERHEVICLSKKRGVLVLHPRVIILAAGCRERNRGNISIPGTRPSGVFTAGLAQRFVNIDGYLPGKKIVIAGSGDIGLIMARRLTWEGATVKGVIEIQPYPGGLTRNIVQCLEDFDIPLYLSHQLTRINGRDRVESVEVTPVKLQGNGDESFKMECDTLLLSIGLLPENEIARTCGVEIHPVTRGAIVDQSLMTSIPGIFACGNVLHVHDVVDWVSNEAEKCGKHACAYLAGESPEGEAAAVSCGNNVRYAIPHKMQRGEKSTISLRALSPMVSGVLKVTGNNITILEKKMRGIHPSNMIITGQLAVPPGCRNLSVSIEGVL